MLKENEVVMLILGVSVLFLIFMNMDHIRRIRYWKILVFSYSILIFGCIFTVTEELVLEQILNLLEHFCYLLSGISMLMWAWKATSIKNTEDIQ